MNIKKVLLILLIASLSACIELDSQIQQLKKQTQGKKIGFFTDPTGIDKQLNMIVDVLIQDKSINIVSLFAPQNGLRGDKQNDSKNEVYKDPITGLPVYRIFGDKIQQSSFDDLFNDIDTIVFLIQDIGLNSYEPIQILQQSLEILSQNGKKVIIFDRPNPIDSITIQGCPNMFNSDKFGRVIPGKNFGLPIRFGMTIGEYAQFINNEYLEKKLDLEIIKMTNYYRSQFYEETGLTWVRSGNNYQNVDSILISSGLQYLSSLGLFTSNQMINLKGIDSYELYKSLSSLEIDGVNFRPVYDNNQNGVEIYVTNRKIDFVQLGATILQQLLKVYPNSVQFQSNDIDQYFGIKDFEKLIKTQNIQGIFDSCQQNMMQFMEIRARNLIYDQDKQSFQAQKYKLQNYDINRKQLITNQLNNNKQNFQKQEQHKFLVILGALCIEDPDTKIVTPSKHLENRLLEAIKIIKENPDKYENVICSGQGYRKLNESYVMKKYLIENSNGLIQDDFIITENFSLDTVENSLFTYNYLYQRFNTNQKNQVLFDLDIITNKFHVNRSNVIYSQMADHINLLHPEFKVTNITFFGAENTVKDVEPGEYFFGSGKTFNKITSYGLSREDCYLKRGMQEQDIADIETLLQLKI